MEHDTDLIDWSAYDPAQTPAWLAGLLTVGRLTIISLFFASIWALAGCANTPKIDHWTFYDCYSAPPHFARPTNCPPRSAFRTQTDRQIASGVARVQQ